MSADAAPARSRKSGFLSALLCCFGGRKRTSSFTETPPSPKVSLSIPTAFLRAQIRRRRGSFFTGSSHALSERVLSPVWLLPAVDFSFRFATLRALLFLGESSGQISSAGSAGQKQEVSSDRSRRNARSQFVQGRERLVRAKTLYLSHFFPSIDKPVHNADFVVPVEIDGTVHQVISSSVCLAAAC